MIDSEKKRIIDLVWGPPLIFALDSTRSFGERVASSKGLGLAKPIETNFTDGELFVKPGENVRGRKTFIIQSFHQIEGGEELSKRISKLLLLAHTLKQSSAEKVTAVIPYLAYSRQDKKTEARDPLSSQELAMNIEASGVNHIIFMDLHDPAIINAYRIPSEVLLPYNPLLEYLDPKLKEYKEIVLIAPDAGALKDRVTPLQKKLKKEYPDLIVSTGYTDKRRDREKGIESMALNYDGTLKGKLVLIPDDESSSGSTMIGTATRVREQSPGEIICFVSHNKITEENAAKIQNGGVIDEFLVTDTILRPPEFFKKYPIFKEISVASLFYKAIEAVHYDGSVSELF
jgi:ribose-phosphate pyrophosphokinase